MLGMMPKSIPPLYLMLEDIGKPSPKKLAKALGVCERSVWRWISLGEAPRPAMLAIYWLTQWGRGSVHADLQNEAVMYAGYVNALKADVARLEAQVESLGRIGDFGSANDALPGVIGPGPVAPQLTFPSIQFPEESHVQPPENRSSSTSSKTGSTQQPRGFQRG